MFGLFGLGKITLHLPRYQYSPGEIIDGGISLKLKKPTKARGLYIILYGEQKTTRSTYRNGHYSRSTYWERIFEFKLPLDGEKEYTSSPLEYNFKINIPKNILQNASKMPEMGGITGTLVKVASAMSGRYRDIRWYVEARLDVPWAVDVKKKAQLNITDTAQQSIQN